MPQLRVFNMAETASCPDVFSPLEKIAEVISCPADQGELARLLPDIDAYFASLHIRLDREMLERSDRLRVIATPSTGTDHIDLKAAAERGVTVLCLKDDLELLRRITATAELAWALLLATVRRLPWAFASAQCGRWARDGFRGHQLSGKTLGILGYGRLGEMVARYGLAFGMKVVACDVRQVQPAAGVAMVDMDELLRRSDVLSIHVHLTDETRGLIGPEAFEKMKPGAVLINTSRGAIVDEAAMLKALESGHLGGAGLDVICGEWSDRLADHPLISYSREHENLVITPHVGGVTFESQRMAMEHAVGKLQSFLEAEHAS